MTLPVHDAADVLHALLVAATKSAAVLAGAAVATLGIRGRAAVRHLVWTMAVTVALLLPLAATVVPAWPVAVLPPRATPAVADPVAVPSRSVPPGPLAVDRSPMPMRVWPADNDGPRPAAAVPPSARFTPAPTRAQPTNGSAIALAAWATGGGIVFARWCLAAIIVRRMTAAAVVITEGPLANSALTVAAEMGLRRAVSVRVGGPVPMVAGIIRPVLRLPADAAAWPARRLRAVLLHELSHVRRHDCATQLLAHLCCCVHWFNPLAWLAAARLRAERERACDDAALRHGADPAAYADTLLAVAAAVRGGGAGPAAVGMARRSGLRRRIRQVLDTSTDRRPVGRPLAIVTLAAAAAVLGGTAAVRLLPRPAHAQTTGASTRPTTEPTTGPARTDGGPRQALSDVISSLERRDVRAAVARYDCPPGQQLALAVELAAVAADMRLKSATVRRFGTAADHADASLTQGSTADEARRAIAAAAVDVRGDTADVYGETSLRRVGGRWLLVPTAKQLSDGADLNGLKLVAAKNQLADEMTAGKVTTVAAEAAEFHRLFAAADAGLGDLGPTSVTPLVPPPPAVDPVISLSRQLDEEVLQRADPGRRRAAMDRLRAMLGDSDPVRQEAALLTIWHTAEVKLDRRGMAPMAVRLLGSPSAGVRRAALGAMWAVQPDPATARPAVVRLASDPDPTVRSQVIGGLLGALRDDSDRPMSPIGEPALTLLGDPDRDVVIDTAQRLWGTPITPAVERKVIELSRWPAEGPVAEVKSVPYWMMYFVLSTREPAVSRPVAERLAELAADPRLDENWHYRCIWGLGNHTASPEARDVITRALVQEVTNSTNDQDRNYAVRGLGRIGTAAALATVRAVADDGQETQQLRALARSFLLTTRPAGR